MYIEYLPDKENKIIAYSFFNKPPQLQNGVIVEIPDSNFPENPDSHMLVYDSTSKMVKEVRNELVVVSITSDDPQAIINLKDNEITLHENYTVTANFEVHINLDGSVNTQYSGIFRMPLRKTTGDIMFTLVSIKEGKGTLSVKMPLGSSGLWEITEKLINEKLPPSATLDFEGFKIYVVL